MCRNLTLTVLVVTALLTRVFEVHAAADSTCRLNDPWRGMNVTVYRDRTKAEDLRGNSLTTPIWKGEILVIVPETLEASSIRIL